METSIIHTSTLRKMEFILSDSSLENMQVPADENMEIEGPELHENDEVEQEAQADQNLDVQQPTESKPGVCYLCYESIKGPGFCNKRKRLSTRKLVCSTCKRNICKVHTVPQCSSCANLD